MLRDLAKRMIIGTAWEGPIKRVHSAITHSKNSQYDYQTIEIMRRVLRPTSVAVDVGSFQGGMLRHMLRFAPHAQHFAIEPIPELADALRSRFPTCHVVHAALGEELGRATFRQVIRNPALSGLKRRVDLAEDQPIREFEVPVETLDHILLADTHIDFVKIDVEGAELGVLRGGLKTLRRSRPIIVFEHGLGGADSYGSSPAGLFDIVTLELDLKISLLGAWLNHDPPLERLEFIRQFEQSVNYYFVAAPENLP